LLRGKIVALAGGVGGAKLVDGLARAMNPENLTVIVNTGDDFEHLGLHICPDIDTVCYTLAGMADPETGWGLKDETWNAFESLGNLGGPDWFQLGDRDLGTHLARTHLLDSGVPLSEVTRRFCSHWNVRPDILPMSDDPVATWVFTDEGELPFQEYFVHRRCEPQVLGFRYASMSYACPAPGVLDSLDQATLIIICPSNPWVSIGPILAVPGIGDALRKIRRNGIPIVAVSPIVGGVTVKGPAAKMYAELGSRPSALAVAKHYNMSQGDNLLEAFVIDNEDIELRMSIEALNLKTLVTKTIMKNSADRMRLAEEILKFGERLFENKVFV
jgi:LPPG:FO 2-phospho-L-lactate transferase